MDDKEQEPWEPRSWTAKVQVGASSAEVTGTGAMNLGDVLAQALGLGSLEISSVIVSGEIFMVGFYAGTKAGPTMMATITRVLG